MVMMSRQLLSFVFYFLLGLIRPGFSVQDSDYFVNFPKGVPLAAIELLDGCTYQTPAVWVLFLSDFPAGTTVHYNVSSWSVDGHLTGLSHSVYELLKTDRGDIIHFPRCAKYLGKPPGCISKHIDDMEQIHAYDILVYEIAVSVKAEDMIKTPKFIFANGNGDWKYWTNIDYGVASYARFGLVKSNYSEVGTYGYPNVFEPYELFDSNDAAMKYITNPQNWNAELCYRNHMRLLPFVPQLKLFTSTSTPSTTKRTATTTTTTSTASTLIQPGSPEVYFVRVDHCISHYSVVFKFDAIYNPHVTWVIGIAGGMRWGFRYNITDINHAVRYPEDEGIEFVQGKDPFILPNGPFTLFICQLEHFFAAKKSFSLGLNQDPWYLARYRVRVDSEDYLDHGVSFFLAEGKAWDYRGWDSEDCDPDSDAYTAINSLA